MASDPFHAQWMAEEVCQLFDFRQISAKLETVTASGMEEILANWNPEEHNGMRRPKLLYTVPVCQNPTGAVSFLSLW